MYIDIQKHHAKYIVVLIEKRMAFIKNKIKKDNEEDWYDYEPSQIEIKLCEVSEEYYRLNQVIVQFYKIN